MPQSVGGKVYRKGRKYLKRYLKKHNGWELAKKAYSGYKYLKGMINCELKKNDQALSSTAVSYSGLVGLQLTNIDQGDQRTARNGVSILCKSVFIRGVVNADDTPVSNNIRLMVVMDTMNTGTAPSLSDVLESTGGALAPFSALKQISAGRFKILWSKLLTVSKVTNQSQVFKAYIPVNKHVKYQGTSGSDEWKNQIYFMAISSVIGSGGSEPTVACYARTSFYDN